MITKNIILGSGMVGLLARYILGDKWTIVPYGRSRFYSFNPPLCDNYIIRDEKNDDVLNSLGYAPKHLYNVKMSLEGNLYALNESMMRMWYNKIMDNFPDYYPKLHANRGTFSVYDVRINQLYARLVNKYENELFNYNAGEVTDIKENTITIGSKKYDYSNIISTIPINLLHNIIGKRINVTSKPIWYYNIKTDSLNFEGANQVLIADDFGFFKCNNIAPNHYMFYCHEDIPEPGVFFSSFLSKFDILDGTTMPGALITSSKPDLNYLKNMNITSVGAYANWDPLEDVGTSMITLSKITT